MARQEFKAGESVTFHPYGAKIKAKVVEVINTGKDQFGRTDSRVFYRLTGSGDSPLVTRTTGKSIVESTLFEKSPEANEH